MSETKPPARRSLAAPRGTTLGRQTKEGRSMMDEETVARGGLPVANSVPRRVDLSSLLKDCPRCKPARAALAVAAQQLRQFVLEANMCDEDEACGSRRVRVFGDFKVECVDCRGTGQVLTGYGKRLVSLVKLYLDSVDQHDLHAPDEDDEIPF